VTHGLVVSVTNLRMSVMKSTCDVFYVILGMDLKWVFSVTELWERASSAWSRENGKMKENAYFLNFTSKLMVSTRLLLLESRVCSEIRRLEAVSAE